MGRERARCRGSAVTGYSGKYDLTSFVELSPHPDHAGREKSHPNCRISLP